MQTLISERQEQRTRDYLQRTENRVINLTKTDWTELTMKHSNGNKEHGTDRHLPDDRFALLEHIGPAIDDEEAAAYISHFLAADDFGNGYDLTATNGQLVSHRSKQTRENEKTFVDLESTHRLADLSGPAIDDEETARYMANFLRD